jgi:hypothetical protein
MDKIQTLTFDHYQFGWLGDVDEKESKSLKEIDAKLYEIKVREIEVRPQIKREFEVLEKKFKYNNEYDQNEIKVNRIKKLESSFIIILILLFAILYISEIITYTIRVNIRQDDDDFDDVFTTEPHYGLTIGQASFNWFVTIMLYIFMGYFKRKPDWNKQFILTLLVLLIMTITNMVHASKHYHYWVQVLLDLSTYSNIICFWSIKEIKQILEHQYIIWTLSILHICFFVDVIVLNIISESNSTISSHGELYLVNILEDILLFEVLHIVVELLEFRSSSKKLLRLNYTEF